MELFENYTVIEKIGEGSFSEVLKVKNKQTGQYYAAKYLTATYSSLDEAMNNDNEMAILKTLAYHQNVISIIDTDFNKLSGRLTLIFNLMDMNLYEYIKNRKKCLSEIRVKYFLYQLLCGLQHLHNSGIFHRDIKPENILIRIDSKLYDANPLNSERLQLADLGSVCDVNARRPMSAYISTRWYRAPECLLTSGYYNSKIDIWAIGCVYYEMLTLLPLFPGENELDQLFKIHAILGTPSNRTLEKFKNESNPLLLTFPKSKPIPFEHILSTLSRNGIDILYKTLGYHPDSRPNIYRLLNHCYFDDLIRIRKRQDNNLRINSNTIKQSNKSSLGSSMINNVRSRIQMTTKSNVVVSNSINGSTTDAEPNLLHLKIIPSSYNFSNKLNKEFPRSSAKSLDNYVTTKDTSVQNKNNLRIKERTWGMNPGPRKDQLIRSVTKSSQLR